MLFVIIVIKRGFLMEDPNNLFQAFANSYFKAFDYLEDERTDLARTQYLLMLDFYQRILEHDFSESLKELMHEQLMKLYTELGRRM